MTYLESIKIDRGYSYGDKINPLQGEIVFNNNNTKNAIKLNLDEELSKKILALCADALVEASKAAAAEMTADIIAGQAPVEMIEGSK